MPWWHWIFWTFLILFGAFLFLPEIKSIFVNKKGAGMERFEAKVDKALVEYDEFKQTIYPLVEYSLAQMVGGRYMSSPPKTEALLDYLPKIEKVIQSKYADNQTVQSMFIACKSIALEEFAKELNLIYVNGKNINGNSDILGLIHHGLLDDYSSDNYVDTDNIYVEFDKLKQRGNELSGSYKERYFKKLNNLKQYYNKYFN